MGLTALTVLFACAALGAFGGCDLDLVRSNHSLSSPGTGILFGGIAGLFVGLLVILVGRFGVFDLRVPRRRYRLRIAYGLVWLLVAAISQQDG